MTRTERATSETWIGLYRLGALAAFLAAVLFRRNCGAEFYLLRSLDVIQAGPLAAPVEAGAWFALLGDSPFVGLLLLNLFDVINYALLGLALLAAYGVLRHAYPGLMRLALIGGAVGVGVNFASNQALTLLALSQRYAAASGEARSTLLAAGEALLAIGNPGAATLSTGGLLSLLLVTLALLIVSWVMLRDGAFGRWAAWLGLAAQALYLLSIAAMALFGPAAAAIPASLAAVPLLIWYLLVARRLFQLSRAA